ncbi:uncharacterized protein LOC112349683 [Selaginella moellendorffii]|uniref:uncharacterized protein LOC112349683 n=1 Tax=Selaginella moellendorffii TaxID=88036 RepID=UPI000D1C2E1E|nr:uncharacterized protein LOC112349683 [Selaginella moellendorffii]|eukprot:XP_024540312.1 uncharacterized protein LOC112349683 [Selaginella moellendorffii]
MGLLLVNLTRFLCDLYDLAKKMMLWTVLLSCLPLLLPYLSIASFIGLAVFFQAACGALGLALLRALLLTCFSNQRNQGSVKISARVRALVEEDLRVAAASFDALLVLGERERDVYNGGAREGGEEAVGSSDGEGTRDRIDDREAREDDHNLEELEEQVGDAWIEGDSIDEHCNVGLEEQDGDAEVIVTRSLEEQQEFDDPMVRNPEEQHDDHGIRNWEAHQEILSLYDQKEAFQVTTSSSSNEQRFDDDKSLLFKDGQAVMVDSSQETQEARFQEAFREKADESVTKISRQHLGDNLEEEHRFLAAGQESETKESRHVARAGQVHDDESLPSFSKESRLPVSIGEDDAKECMKVVEFCLKQAGDYYDYGCESSEEEEIIDEPTSPRAQYNRDEEQDIFLQEVISPGSCSKLHSSITGSSGSSETTPQPGRNLRGFEFSQSSPSSAAASSRRRTYSYSSSAGKLRELHDFGIDLRDQIRALRSFPRSSSEARMEEGVSSCSSSSNEDLDLPRFQEVLRFWREREKGLELRRRRKNLFGR